MAQARQADEETVIETSYDHDLLATKLRLGWRDKSLLQVQPLDREDVSVAMMDAFIDRFENVLYESPGDVGATHYEEDVRSNRGGELTVGGEPTERGTHVDVRYPKTNIGGKTTTSVAGTDASDVVNRRSAIALRGDRTAVRKVDEGIETLAENQELPDLAEAAADRTPAKLSKTHRLLMEMAGHDVPRDAYEWDGYRWTFDEDMVEPRS